jgi:hypothetical protein
VAKPGDRRYNSDIWRKYVPAWRDHHRRVGRPKDLPAAIAARSVAHGGQQVAILEIVLTLISYWLSLVAQAFTNLLDYRAWQRFLS